MQIAEKYQKDYEDGLVKIRAERTRFIQALERLSGIRVIPSQANYVMVELEHGMRAKSVTKRLLLEHNIFVKDLSGKLSDGEYLRLAVRNQADNDKLIQALQQILV
jgi:histidinol-phosphate/aromatic aminotransferase/cobyric acid decarboxylase-like protein